MTTPMMKQYHEIKDRHQDCVLLYRLGDFYELFHEDAVSSAGILGITLTKRGDSIPMCGIPFHAAENYIKKLLDHDFKVAICEQMESPKPGQKGPVRRDVVRILTKGTITENLGDNPHYLIVFSPTYKDKVGVAICDLSTGFLRTETALVGDIDYVIAKYKPMETIIPESLKDHFKRIITIPDSRFNYDSCMGYLKKHFTTTALDCFGNFDKTEIQAAGFLIDYLFITQKQALQHITKIQQCNSSEYMFLNATTRQSLELMETLNGKLEGSLIHTLNHTRTALGKRMLIDRLNNPLLNITIINERLDQVEIFVKNKDLLTAIRQELQAFPDLERCLTRLSLRRSGPKDLKAIQVGLVKSALIGEKINHPLSDSLSSLKTALQNTLKEEVPVHTNDGGFIQDSFSSTLDHYRVLKNNAATLIQDLENQYKQTTGINNLRIKFNNVWGYFIEVTSSHISKVPNEFTLKQTLSTGHRYTTEELSKLQNEILSAQTSVLEEEIQIFHSLVTQVVECLYELQELSLRIANLDVASCIAYIGINQQYTRPIVDDSNIFDIQEGRHPALDNNFIPNSCVLDGLHIITGPNMGGKSTYLRQNAIITIMAQAGLYVPCARAHIGVIDKVMTRIGASDDISQGRSTFMVEMIETSAILHNATPKSLVILDEIGRGTSTSDGLAIAFAVSEYLLEHNQSKVLFATHYHELSRLNHPKVKFYHVAIQEWNGSVIFLHKIKEGFCDRSYGIHVAELAGFPKEVIEKANKFVII